MHKPRILIAEDDPNFGLVLKSYLSLNGYEINLCDDGNKALSAFQNQRFDLCILDVMMPYRDGFSVAESMQRSGSQVPLVFLTAKALKEDQIKGYQLGAIDYLVKPFDPDILLLKVRAILSQTTAGPKPDIRFQIGAFVFDARLRSLTSPVQQWKLSPKESELLLLLCQQAGQLLHREEALLKIWKEDNFFTAQSMNVYITKLRNYFRSEANTPVEMENLHGKGFLLRPAAHILPNSSLI